MGIVSSVSPVHCTYFASREETLNTIEPCENEIASAIKILLSAIFIIHIHYTLIQRDILNLLSYVQ